MMQTFITKTKTLRKLIGTGLVAAALGGHTGFAQAEVISQTFQQAAGGALDFGQYFELDSTIFSEPQQLESIEFAKGNNNTTATAIYLDIYEIGTADITIPIDFTDRNTPTTGTQEVAKTNYLGSSDNAVNFTAATDQGGTLLWTFSGITLPTDTALFAVISDDNVAGDHRGLSLMASRNRPNGPGTPFAGAVEYTNITTDVSAALFGGTPSPDVLTDSVIQDNFYIITVVPEPGSLALLSLGALMVARRRRG
ncbi:MAG: PEP-CTERM sorting domain-containing protein [Planctomycetota bacterium]